MKHPIKIDNNSNNNNINNYNYNGIQKERKFTSSSFANTINHKTYGNKNSYGVSNNSRHTTAFYGRRNVDYNHSDDTGLTISNFSLPLIFATSRRLLSLF